MNIDNIKAKVLEPATKDYDKRWPIIIALVALVVSFISCYQSNQSIKLSKEANYNNLSATNPPLLDIANVNLVFTGIETHATTNDISTGERIKGKFTFDLDFDLVNKGHQPARVTWILQATYNEGESRIRRFMLGKEKDLKPKLIDGEYDKVFNETIVLPSESKHIKMKGRTSKINESDKTFMLHLYVAYLSGSKNLYDSYYYGLYQLSDVQLRRFATTDTLTLVLENPKDPKDIIVSKELTNSSVYSYNYQESIIAQKYLDAISDYPLDKDKPKQQRSN